MKRYAAKGDYSLDTKTAQASRAKAAYEGYNRRHKYAFEFSTRGIRLFGARRDSGQWSLQVDLKAIEIDGRPLEFNTEKNLARVNRYRARATRQIVTEYIVNRPGGLKHGFKINRPKKAANRRLELKIKFESKALEPVRVRGESLWMGRRTGRVDPVVRYSDLYVVDSRGRELKGKFVEQASDTVTISVDISSAKFPVHIDPDFQTDARMPMQNGSSGVGVADFDGDGTEDMFVANSLEGNRVWFGDGNGGFSDSGQILGDADSRDVALRDLDGDTDIDAFAVNAGASNNGNAVWLGDGNGQFSDAGQSLGSVKSADVALGDVDGDGDPDAFVANANNSGNRLWLNDGNASFTASGQSFASETSRGVSLSDLDGDGDLDVFIANEGPNTVWINRGGNQGGSEGDFSDSGQSVGTGNSRDVTLGDLDGDNNVDALVLNQGDDIVWLNDGQGNFTDSGHSIGLNSSNEVFLRDFDADGDADAFIVAGSGANRLYVNDGNGEFSNSGQRLGSNNSSGGAVTDLNGDGDDDVFVTNYNARNTVYLGQGNGTFSSRSSTGHALGSRYSRSLGVGDLTGDGAPDAFVGKGTWVNSGSGAFQNFNELKGISYDYAAALGDLDDDGDLDAYLVRSDSTNGDQVWINDGGGALTDSGQLLDPSSGRDIDLGDLDGDGTPDAFVANVNAPNTVWLNDGNANFTDSNQTLGNNTSTGVVLADFDGDQTLEAFATNRGEGNTYWDNDGRGNFTNSGQSLGTATSRDVAAGDLDGDDAPDVFVANDSSEPNTVWMNDGSGNFTDSGQGLGSVHSAGVSLGDVDGDGDVDVFVANELGMGIAEGRANRIYLNDGVGGFSDSGLRLGRMKSQGVELAYLDNDRLLDAVVINNDANVVWINRANTSPEASFDSVLTQQNTPVSIKVLNNDRDPEGDPISIDSYTQPPNGTVNDTTSDDGLLSYIPNTDFYGTDTFDYTVVDSHGATDSATVEVTVNASPTASIGAGTSIIDLGSSIQLDASSSSDPDGTMLEYSWRLQKAPSGSSLELPDRSDPVITVSPETAGEYAIEITVKDPEGSSDTAVVSFAVNGPPEAVAEAEAEFVAPGNSVTVSAAGSSDDGIGSGELTYEWRLVQQPADSSLALSEAAKKTVEFTPDESGKYALQVTVSDNRGLSDTASAKVIGNVPPEVSIQKEGIVVPVGEPTRLDGSATTDPDGPDEQLDYNWSIGTRPAQSTASVSSASTPTIAFTPDESGLYQLRLTVTDAAGQSESTTAVFRGNWRPEADIARDSVEVRSDTAVTFDATSSRDAESTDEELTFEWKVAEKPEDSGSFEIPDKPDPTVFFTEPGDYKIQLTVRDETGFEDTDEVEVLSKGGPEYVEPTPGQKVVATSGQVVKFPVEARDSAGNELEVEVTSMPEGADFEDGRVNWDTVYPNTGTYTFKFRTPGSKIPATYAVDVVVDLEKHASCGRIRCGNKEVCNEGLCFKTCNDENSCNEQKRSCFGGQRCAESACSRIECGVERLCYQGTCFSECENNCPGPRHRCIDGRCATGQCAGVQCNESKVCDGGKCVGRRQLEDAEDSDGRLRTTQQFQSSPVGGAEEESRDAKLADLAGDGDLDLVVANNPSPNTVWENNGNGQFEKAFETPSANPTRGMALGDLDGDNQIDVFAANRGEPNVVWKGDGNLEFTKKAETSVANRSENVALGDLDGDNQLDAFVANARGDPNVAFENDGTGHFTRVFETETGRSSSDVALGDLDGDNQIDVFVANRSEKSLVLENNGSFQFESAYTTAFGSSSEGVALGDLNGDNRIDAFVVNGNGEPDTVLKNGGNFAFLNAFETSIAKDSSGVALGDLDGDNQLDAVVAARDSDQIAIFRNTGGFSFTAHIHETQAQFSESVVIGDVHGDESLDILVAKKGAKNELVTRQTRSGETGDGGGCSCSTGSDGLPANTPVGAIFIVSFGLLWIRCFRRRTRRG